jgi:hypothetical protein
MFSVVIYAQRIDAPTPNAEISMTSEYQSYFPTNEVLANDFIDDSNFNKLYSNVDLSKIEGSPYMNNEFQLGKVYNRITKNVSNFLLRYNIYNDEIQIKVNDNNTSRVLIKSNDYFVIFNNSQIFYEKYLVNNKIETGYFILKYTGKSLRLFEKKNKIFQDAKPSKDSFHNSIPAKFKDNSSYYIKSINDEILHPVSSSKKAVLDNFPNHEKELKTYIKSEKINLKDENDLKKLLTYYDMILTK